MICSSGEGVRNDSGMDATLFSEPEMKLKTMKPFRVSPDKIRNESPKNHVPSRLVEVSRKQRVSTRVSTSLRATKTNAAVFGSF